MKKRFQNILAKTGKKNGAVVLICALILAVSLGTLVGCSIMKENAETAPGRLGTEDSETKDNQVENSQTDEPLPESGSSPSETDDAGSENASGEQSSGESKQDEVMPFGIEERYKAILLGEEDFVRIDYRGEDKSLNIKNIKKVVTDEDRITARVKKFTIIDLDGNGENEIVLWIEVNDGSDFGFEILYYKDQEVYGVTLPYRAFLDLKTDGTFYYSGGMEDSGIGRLQFSESGYTIEDVSDRESQVGKPDVGWYDLTAENVELALENGF